VKPFERSDEATHTTPASARLLAFMKALWDAFVPDSGECLSVQGELVRVNDRLVGELLRNGFGNYYEADDDEKLEDMFYGKMLLFLLDTLVANRGEALDVEDVAYFEAVRGAALVDWNSEHVRRARISELEEKCGDEGGDDAVRRELDELEEAHGDGPDWERIFARAERCVANWCLVNQDLIDRNGRSIEDGGVRRVDHVFNPPPPPPPCPKCNGKGWLPAASAGEFPKACWCKQLPHAPELYATRKD